jgi:hypothetical protein
VGLSFAQLWEQVDKEKARRGSPLMTSGEPDRAIITVRSGKDMHKEDQTPFWDEFISLCSNADGLSELLEVPANKIRTWPSRIKELLGKLDQQNAVDPAHKDNAEMIPTGHNGAFTVNSDPTNIGDMQ